MNYQAMCRILSQPLISVLYKCELFINRKKKDLKRFQTIALFHNIIVTIISVRNYFGNNCILHFYISKKFVVNETLCQIQEGRGIIEKI